MDTLVQEREKAVIWAQVTGWAIALIAQECCLLSFFLALLISSENTPHKAAVVFLNFEGIQCYRGQVL